MYGERHALKTRLEELNHAEERTIRHYQEERERIYERLRKLDENERLFSGTPSEPEKEIHIEDLNSQNAVMNEQVKLMVETIREDMEKENQSTLQHLTQQLNEAKEIISSLQQIQIPKLFLETKDQSSNNEIDQKENKKEAGTSKKNKTTSKGTTKNKRTALKNKDVTVKVSEQDKIDYTPLYEEALTILKRHTASIQSVEIKKELEEKMGIQIPNMTTFMERLMKKNPLIEKPFRGQYVYRHENISMAEKEGNDVLLTGSEAEKQIEKQETLQQEELLEA